jgi:hypothetical protein
MAKRHQVCLPPIISSLLMLCVLTDLCEATEVTSNPRGEIQAVETWRLDINVLGHNVLRYFLEYALDGNELAPSLAVSWK